ncbi:MAG: radical SAM protein [Desulfobacterales bacterium]|nr:radical SAM protein [Desulfobacterales bacterium]
MSGSEPAYIRALKNGTLRKSMETARHRLRSCTLCPRKCGVDRKAGQIGTCQTGADAQVSSCTPHFGEESPLAGTRGSGTIFFTHCNLLCQFCQNYEISHLGHGQVASTEQLADMMLRLQDAGCHNINLVTPSHVIPMILSAVETAAVKGLDVPLVYNTSAYDRVTSLKLLDGVVDIYMPDFKFWDSRVAEITCQAPDYPAVARKALREMHRQVGDLIIDASGLARKGLLIRHLVLPGGLAGSRKIMRFIARKISPNSYVNIMAQYRPCGTASQIEGLSAFLSKKEYQEALRAAGEEGLTRLDMPERFF